jgi:PmbA protein
VVHIKSKNIVKKVLDMGADDVVCELVKEKMCQVRFSNNEITAAKEFNSVRAEIFVAKGKKTMNFTLENVETIEEDLKKAVNLLDTMQESKDYHGIAQGPFEYRKTVYDKSIADADPVELAHEVIEACEVDRIAGVLFTRYQNVDFASLYTEAVDKRAYVETSVRVFENGCSGHGVNVSSALKGFDGAQASIDASELAKKAQSPESGKEGKYDILFTPLCFATLFSSADFSISAFFVDSGISFFWGKIGKEVASPKFTVVNDGTIKEGIYSKKFDKEGVPTKKTPIIEKGVLKSYLHNSSTAKKFNTETTANAGLDVPLPQNLIIGDGDKTQDELISDIDRGLMVTNTWYTRFQNYMTGDFSTIPRDAILKIEDGSITGSVDGIRISDNMLNVLQNIDGLGKGTQQIHWWECEFPVFSPYVLVRDIGVTTSTK